MIHLQGLLSSHENMRELHEVPESMSTRRIKITHGRLLFAIRLLLDELSDIIINKDYIHKAISRNHFLYI